MKQERNFKAIQITKKQEKTVKEGHPWIYEDEITESSEAIENGSLVDVRGAKGQYLGTGIYSETSKIRVRILDNNANETFGQPFFERRVRYALQYRKDTMQEDFSACRLIHGEADGLPGLTIDRYENILVSEVLSYGIDQRKDRIYHALVTQLQEMGEQIDGIFERNEGELRLKEGLAQHAGWYEADWISHPESPIVTIHENGISYTVDVENGQKTGFFLDQKYNRRAIARLAKGKTVLDCCTHTGSFALNAVQGGATLVEAADISEDALAMAKKNAEANGFLDRMTFTASDVFVLLQKYLDEHKKFDLIVLDPPAFTKSRRTFEHAYNGYLRINSMAMRLLPRGSYLATASCSHFMPNAQFRKMLKEAAMNAGVKIRIVEERHAAYDHPILLGVPETDYLKFYILQIM